MLRLWRSFPRLLFGDSMQRTANGDFSFTPTATRKREIGSEIGSYSNAPLGSGASWGLLFGDSMQRTANGDFSFTPTATRKREIGGEMGSYSNAPLGGGAS